MTDRISKAVRIFPFGFFILEEKDFFYVQIKKEKIRNLGEVSLKMLAEIEIYTLDEIKKLGPIIIYNLLKARGFNVTIMMVYALQGAILDCHWNELPKRIKEELKQEIENNKFNII